MALDSILKILSEDVNGEMQLGGVPFYASDFLRLQKNANLEAQHILELFKQHAPEIIVRSINDNSLLGTYKQGLYLNNPQITNNVTPFNAVEIGEFNAMIDGNFLKFNGGIFDFGSGSVPSSAKAALIKVSDTVTQDNRVFRDGNSKVFSETRALEVVETTISFDFGSILIDPNDFDDTKEYILLTSGDFTPSTLFKRPFLNQILTDALGLEELRGLVSRVGTLEDRTDLRTFWADVPTDSVGSQVIVQSVFNNRQLRYYRDRIGNVFLQGTVRVTTGSLVQDTSAFLLPPGFRPLRAITKNIGTNVNLFNDSDSNTTIGNGRVDISTAGSISFDNQPDTDTFYYFDTLVFPTI